MQKTILSFVTGVSDILLHAAKQENRRIALDLVDLIAGIKVDITFIRRTSKALSTEQTHST